MRVDEIISHLPRDEAYWDRRSFAEIWDRIGDITKIKYAEIGKKQLNPIIKYIFGLIEFRLLSLRQDEEIQRHITNFCKGPIDAFSPNCQSIIGRQFLELTFMVHYCLEGGMLSSATIGSATLLAKAFYLAFNVHNAPGDLEVGVYYNHVVANSINHKTYLNEALQEEYLHGSLQTIKKLPIPANIIIHMEWAKQLEKAIITRRAEQEQLANTPIRPQTDSPVELQVELQVELPPTPPLKSPEDILLIEKIAALRKSDEFLFIREYLGVGEAVSKNGALYFGGLTTDVNSMRKLFRQLDDEKLDPKFFNPIIRKLLGKAWSFLKKDDAVHRALRQIAKKFHHYEQSVQQARLTIK